MTPHDHLAQAEAAEVALEQFIKPAFDALRTVYQKKLKDNGASFVITRNQRFEQYEKLSLALNVLDLVEGQVEAIVEGGKVAEAEIEKKNRLAKIRPHKRSVLGV